MRKTVSKLLMDSPRTAKERDLLVTWCDMAAAGGGTFQVVTAWECNNYYVTYTIEWPDHMSIPAGVKHG